MTVTIIRLNKPCLILTRAGFLHFIYKLLCMLQRSCKIHPFYCSEMALPRNHLWNESEGTEQKKPTCQHSTFIHFQPDILHQIFVPGMIVGTLLPEFWREKSLWALKVAWKGSVSLPACYFTHNIFQFYWESFFKACWSDGNENDF